MFSLCAALVNAAVEGLGSQVLEAGPDAKPLAAYALIVFEVNGVQEIRAASACTKPCKVDLDQLRVQLATIPAPVPEG